MSSKLRTLIVFDTNSLRSTDEGEIAYSFFAFGKPFQLIEEFVTTNTLNVEVQLAIPDWAIRELKDQKERQYHLDVEEYKKLAKRLSGLPHTGEIIFPDVDFDCSAFIEDKATEFILTRKIVKLELKDEISNLVLKSMMSRVMRGEKKSPFANYGKYKDAGFKDNLIWESLMNYDNVVNYDKVIFMTKDGDFNRHCVEEFKTKWGKYVTIEKDEINVIATLQKDYRNYLDNRKIYEFADKEYFDNYLRDLLNHTSKIHINGIDFNIENYQILKHCDKVETTTDDEGDFVSPVIYSTVLISTTKVETKSEFKVIAKTKLSDIAYMDIEETTFEPNLF